MSGTWQEHSAEQQRTKGTGMKKSKKYEQGSQDCGCAGSVPGRYKTMSSASAEPDISNAMSEMSESQSAMATPVAMSGDGNGGMAENGMSAISGGMSEGTMSGQETSESGMGTAFSVGAATAMAPGARRVTPEVEFVPRGNAET